MTKIKIVKVILHETLITIATIMVNIVAWTLIIHAKTGGEILLWAVVLWYLMVWNFTCVMMWIFPCWDVFAPVGYCNPEGDERPDKQVNEQLINDQKAFDEKNKTEVL